MKNFNFKKILPHLVAVAIFLIVSVIYCRPALEGKVVYQQDIQNWQGMVQQSKEFNNKYGYYPLWINSAFSGMPGYQIFLDARTHILAGYLEQVITFGLPKPISFFFLASVCFYLLCVIAGINPWISIMGGIAYAYSTFDPIIVAVGHDTEMMSIGYMPAVLAGILLLFQKRYWSGFAVTAVFAALLIGQNHVQMLYYTLITAAIMFVVFLIKSIKEKQAGVAIKSGVLALLAGLLGLACSAVTMMPTAEYAKESTRGGRSELTENVPTENKTKGGLDKEEAFRWSYGLGETLTFILPDLYGGGSRDNQYNDSKFVEKLTEAGLPQDQAAQEAAYSIYWGNQPSTAGPVYLGAIICFLFIFGLFYIKDGHKWWVVTASALAILLAWGANLKEINYFLFDHLPLYNKFRAVTMSLVIPQLCFPFLGMLAVNKLINETDWALAWKKLRMAVYVSGAVLLLLAGFYFGGSFTGNNDKQLRDGFRQSILSRVPQGQQAPSELQQQADQISSQFISALKTDRKDLMGADLLRNILLIAGAVVLTGLFVRKKVNAVVLTAGLIVLSSFDLLSVASRYLNSDSFVDDSDFQAAFVPDEADQQILKDPDHANFRVFNESNPRALDADAQTSYWHNSVGGYHPAILGLYNDIIDNQLSRGNMQVFDMLNTKYFIVQNPQTGKRLAQLNPDAFGNAWLVKGIKYVNNADEEMDALDSTHLKDTAVVDKRYQAAIKQPPVYDSAAYIRLKQNLNDKIDYTFHSTTPQFAVMSEVYYPFGWDAYIDGKKAGYVKTDYVLRGMYLPAGDHEIEFRFEPKSFYTGRTITIVASILVYLLLIAAIVVNVIRKP
ncbi:MAG TPA: YfhO family protein [Chitinophagaceae bacterium]|nr:YfhO family protein [Chitinophagaceae bacterium]